MQKAVLKLKTSDRKGQKRLPFMSVHPKYLKKELDNINEVIERRQHILEFKTLEKNKILDLLDEICVRNEKATRTQYESFFVIDQAEKMLMVPLILTWPGFKRNLTIQTSRFKS
jgi:hypothetical protein